MPRYIEVRTDSEGTPIAVARGDAHGHRGSLVAVEGVQEVWRLAEAWWRESAQRRTYYRVILEGGRPLTIYRDDVTGVWAEQPYTEPQTS
jgi:hypothetical protein